MRTNEALGAEFTEISLKDRIWIIPAGRTKTIEERRIPLVGRALQILTELCEKREGRYVFSGWRVGEPMSNAAMTKILKLTGRDVTVHGFRSTFCDWVSASTEFKDELREMALGHKVGTKVMQAYRRGDGFKKRYELMAAWDEFATSAKNAVVSGV